MSFRQRSDYAPLLVLVGEGFFSRFSFSLMGFALPLYARHLGMSLHEIGLLISLNVAVTIALKPAMGWAADHFGWRRSAIAGVGLRSLVPLLLAYAWLPWQLYGIRAVHGAAEAVRGPSVNTLLATHGDKNKAVASAFAWYATARSAAAGLGHATSGVLLTLTAGDFSLVFVVAFALSTLPLGVVAGFMPRDRDHEPVAAKPVAEGVPSDLDAAPVNGDRAATRPSLLPVAGLGFFMTTSAQMLHGLFPILATEYAGLNPAQTGIIYAASTCVVLFSGPLFGWLSDRVSRDLVLLVRGGANIISSGVYLAAPNFAGIAVGRCVDDVGKAAFRPAWGAVMAIVSGFDRKRRARTMSLTSLGEDVGDIVGPVLAGFLWHTWGVAALLGVRILLAAVTECYALAIGRKLHLAERQRAADQSVLP